MNKRTRSKIEAEVKEHLDAIMEIEHGWRFMLDVLLQRAVQKMLREARIAQGLTQEQLAETMGVERARIAQLETVRYPDFRIATLGRWSNALGLELSFGAVPIPQEEVDE